MDFFFALLTSIGTSKGDFISKIWIIIQSSIVNDITNGVIQSFTAFQSSWVVFVKANYYAMQWKICLEDFWLWWEWQEFVNVIMITSMIHCNPDQWFVKGFYIEIRRHLENQKGSFDLTKETRPWNGHSWGIFPSWKPEEISKNGNNINSLSRKNIFFCFIH